MVLIKDVIKIDTCIVNNLLVRGGGPKRSIKTGLWVYAFLQGGKSEQSVCFEVAYMKLEREIDQQIRTESVKIDNPSSLHERHIKCVFECLINQGTAAGK